MPIAVEADRLLVRGADLLVLGVAWSGLTPSSGGPGRLTAGENAHVTVVFPPQSLAEAKYVDGNDVSRRGARPSGSSRVTFKVAAGTTIDLTIEGLLAALAADPQAIVTRGDGDPTALELPWRLTVAPQAPSGTDVVSAHEVRPVVSGNGVVGLWHSSLHARNAGAVDAGIELFPLRADQNDAGLDVQPLSGQNRQSIVDAAHAAEGPALAHARRVELSALGGSLSAALSSAALDWTHEATLGRDHYVRVVERGVLYPFGHRAAFIETAKRVLRPAGSRAVAGLHRETLLLVLEPLRPTVDGDLELRRRFPFSAVEILASSFPDIKPPADAEWITIRRPVLPHGQLAEQRAELVSQHQQLVDIVNDRIAAQPATLGDFLSAGLGSSLALADAQGRLAQVPDPAALEQENREIHEQVDRLEEEASHLGPTTGPDGETIPGDEAGLAIIREQIASLIASLHSQGEIAQARADQAAISAEVNQLLADVQAEFDGLPRTLHDFALLGDEEAQRAEALIGEIAALDARVAAIAAAEEEDHPVGFVPRAPGGDAFRFPLRLAAAGGDVSIAVPLVFVKDFSLAEEEFFPEFQSLADPVTAGKIAEAWSAHAEVELGGVTIDMVNSDQPQPGDRHEVHRLTLEAVPHEGGFRPRVTQFDVALPSLRALLPDTDGIRTLRYTDVFLTAARIPELPFAFDPGFSGDPKLGIVTDFVSRADRSGGLVAPKFVIDGISRSLGPVAGGALPPALASALPPEVPRFDLASVYKGATLLGFPLALLVRLPADPLAGDELPLPPGITQLVENGVPSGMRMSWTLELERHGPFRPQPSTKLVLTVECSPTKRETTCTVNDFSLVLPPGGAEGLLKLNFGVLRFTQREGHPPDLDIQGMTLDFGGALKLLQELQEALQKVIDLPGTGPKVDVRPTGLTAGYGISVPTVAAGAFLLSNIAMRVGVDVPFDGKPVTVSLSFASRDNPFNVSVLAFGGGGYVDLTIGPKGLLRLEASIDFGASIEVDFVVARGEVHALGGVRFRQSGAGIEIDGFISIGGSVEVIGLVSVSVELLVTLTYRPPNRLVGRATIVVEIDLTLFSDSVEIDSGEWVIAGSELPPPPDEPDLVPLISADDGALIAWKIYRGAFAA
jgi:hypothetical protein